VKRVRVVLKVRKKGILILPKKLREEVGISEGGEVVVEVREGKLIIRALKPRVVNVDVGFVEKLLSEEYDLEKERYRRILRGGEASS